jgi:hypothetical protein
MAGGPVMMGGGKTHRYDAKMTMYVWLVCILGGCGGLLLGYDNGIIGGRPMKTLNPKPKNTAHCTPSLKPNGYTWPY